MDPATLDAILTILALVGTAVLLKVGELVLTRHRLTSHQPDPAPVAVRSTDAIPHRVSH